MKRRDYLIRRLELTTPQERQQQRNHEFRIAALAAIVIVIVVAMVIGYADTYPHCIDGIKAVRVCTNP